MPTCFTLVPMLALLCSSLLCPHSLWAQDSTHNEVDTIIELKVYHGFQVSESVVDTSLTHLTVDQANLNEHLSLAPDNIVGARYRFFDFQSLFARNLFLYHYNDYLFNLDEIPIYKTKRPFSKLDYMNSLGSKTTAQQSLHILHTQNVSEKFNFGFNWHYKDDEGSFTNNKHTMGNLNFFLSYEGNQYTIRTKTVYNGMTMQHFGGVDSANYHGSVQTTKNYLTQLSQAKGLFRNKGIVVDQTFLFWNNSQSRAAFGYLLRYDDYRMEYQDISPVNNYYPLINDSSTTFDSLSSRNFDNSFYLHLSSEKHWIPELKLSYDHIRFGRGYRQNHKSSTEETAFTSLNFTSNQLAFQLLYRQLDKWHIRSSVCYEVSGYSKDGYVTDIIVQRGLGDAYPLIANLQLTHTQQQVDPFLMNYSSNHVQWKEKLFMPEVSSLHVSLLTANEQFDLGFEHYSINHFVYFNHLYQTVQPQEQLNVRRFYLDYRFSLFKFVSQGKISFHTADQNWYVLPDYALSNSTWFDHTIFFHRTGGVLHLQLGFNTRYMAQHDAYRYSPVINQFLSAENGIAAGGFPVFDVFLALKVKSVRLLLQYENLNIQEDQKNNYYIYPYPVDLTQMRLGLSWIFYN